ncbi:MAG TPA: RbsD/FucU family protein [Clostridia bacterium]|nr:RbsD/FucU family protein [Clostridia bacterium]
MLLNVPKILSPELLTALDQMGHTDEIVLSDGNFPALTMSQGSAWGKPIYMKGVGVPELLDAVLTMIPLDYLAKESVIGMLAPADQGEQPIHQEFPKVLEKHGYGADRLGMLPKPDFYGRAKNACCVVVTGEGARFANIIVRKGVVR